MNSIKRIKLVKLLLSLAFLVITIYIFILQTVYSKTMKLQAAKQHCDSIPLLAERGMILDTKKRPIVFNQLCASIRILPNQIRCRDSIADVLTSYNLKPRPDIIRDLQDNSALFLFKKYVDYQIANELKKVLRRRRIDNSVYVADDLKRIYPFGQTISSITGFYGDEQGLAGIEFSFNNILCGKPGWIIIQKDAIGNKFYWPSYPAVQPVNGNDIVLTVDLEIQEIAFKNLAKYVDSFQAIKGSVVILDASDGEILAMADYPTFDPQNYKEFSPHLWKASAVCDEFEPGSVYKLLICATALESKDKDLLQSQTYDVSKGFLTISGRKIKDVHNNGIINFDEIFVKSSNMGVSMLSQMVSGQEFFLMERRFGLGLQTGIELPGEANGFLDRPRALTPLRFANNAFGQGVRITLLQLSMAYLAIAQNGQLLKPYIVKQINNNGKTIYHGEKKIVRRVLDENTALRIKDILAQAVADGTGRAAQLDNYVVCGKTGTGQKIEPDGKYSSKKSMMTFIGFFPKETPKYLIAVLIDEPKISRFAGEVTCPLFKTIATKLLQLQKSEKPHNNGVVVLY